MVASQKYPVFSLLGEKGSKMIYVHAKTSTVLSAFDWTELNDELSSAGQSLVLVADNLLGTGKLRDCA